MGAENQPISTTFIFTSIGRMVSLKGDSISKSPTVVSPVQIILGFLACYQDLHPVRALMAV